MEGAGTGVAPLHSWLVSGLLDDQPLAHREQYVGGASDISGFCRGWRYPEAPPFFAKIRRDRGDTPIPKTAKAGIRLQGRQCPPNPEKRWGARRMNYYERYCGDYTRDTGHLSLQEHGAYTVMLDTYYATETPLPADYESLYRICRAMTGKEREAVRNVADAFFKLNGDGSRHNPKADEIIEKARKRIAAAKVNGSKNIPSGLPSGIPSGLPNGSPIGHIGTSTRPQTPINTTSKALSGKPDPRDYLNEAKDVLQYLNANAGRTYRPVETNLRLIVARLKSGVTPLQMREVVFDKCQQWGKDEKMMEYLRPKTLFGAVNFEQYLGGR